MIYTILAAVCVTYFVTHIIATGIKMVIEQKRIDSDNERIKTDMALAEAQSKAMTAKSYEELKNTLDAICNFVIANEIVLVVGNEFTRDERNDLLINQTADISSKITDMLSPEFIRQYSYYVGIRSNIEEDDFLKYYIRKTVMTKVTDVIEARTKVIEQKKNDTKAKQ